MSIRKTTDIAAFRVLLTCSRKKAGLFLASGRQLKPCEDLELVFFTTATLVSSAEMEGRPKGDVLREGLIVSLGQNMFSFPKLQWFSLRDSGLFYSPRERGTGTEPCSESLIEFNTMFVRVDQIEEEKFVYRSDKVTVYCLRVGDKRKCRILCFKSWEERDFWMISILTAIAQFKISNERRDEFCGKIRASSSSSTMRRGGKPSSLRLTRSDSERLSIRKRFTSLRTRKSMRKSVDGDLNENVFVKTACSSTRICAEPNEGFRKISEDSVEQVETGKSFSQMGKIASQENVPPSPGPKPWLFDRLTSAMDFGKKRHFSSFRMKFS